MGRYVDFIGQWVLVELSGNKRFNGMIVDAGQDIIVLRCNAVFYYIPTVHIQRCTKGKVPSLQVDASESGEANSLDEDGWQSGTLPMEKDANGISFRKILTHAKGYFLEIYVSGNTAVHGYLTSIMNDYFVFHSPIYKTIYVSLQHLKWLVPYPRDATPYSLSEGAIKFHPATLPVYRSFRDQCKKLEGNLVVFDLGDNPNKIGLLVSVDSVDNTIELVSANGQIHYWNLAHLKTVHVP